MERRRWALALGVGTLLGCLTVSACAVGVVRYVVLEQRQQWVIGTWESQVPWHQFTARLNADGSLLVMPTSDRAIGFGTESVPAEGYRGRWVATPTSNTQFKLTIMRDGAEPIDFRLYQTGPDEATLQATAHYPLRRVAQ